MKSVGQVHLCWQILPVAELFKIGVFDDAASREVRNGHLFELLLVVVIFGYYDADLNRDHHSE